MRYRIVAYNKDNKKMIVTRYASEKRVPANQLLKHYSSAKSGLKGSPLRLAYETRKTLGFTRYKIEKQKTARKANKSPAFGVNFFRWG